MGEIYVLMSFRLYTDKNNDKRVEEGRKFWFSSLEKVLGYIEYAGKPVPGEDNTYYDEPYECRWPYIVVEKVMEGPMSINEIVGWWKADIENGNIKEYVKLTSSPIHDWMGTDPDCGFNFTGIG